MRWVALWVLMIFSCDEPHDQNSTIEVVQRESLDPSDGSDGLDNLNSRSSVNSNHDETTSVDELDEISEKGMIDFLENRDFDDWEAKQIAPINGVAAHRKISLTYANKIAAQAMKDQKKIFPIGSMFVKTMYEDDRKTEVGHALMVKVQESDDESSWVWFEGFLPDYRRPYYGKNVSVCLGCHSDDGIDYVRTEAESLGIEH